jgi:hypothetical protein
MATAAIAKADHFKNPGDPTICEKGCCFKETRSDISAPAENADTGGNLAFIGRRGYAARQEGPNCSVRLSQTKLKSLA